MNSEQRKGYMLVFVSGIMWGTIGLFATILNNMGMKPIQVAFFRLLAASVILVPVLLISGGPKLFRISRKGLLSCVLVGFLSQALYNLFYMNAIEQTGMATAAILLYTAPIFVAVMSRIFFKEKMGGNKVAAIIINIIGCTLTVTGGDFSGMKISLFGVLMGVLAGFTYGLLPILSRIGADEEEPLTASFYGLAFGAVLLFFVARPFSGAGMEIHASMGLVIFGYGLIPTAVTYIVYFNGLKRVKETSRVPVIASIETVAAAVIGFLVFHESFTLFKVIGIVLVFCSIMIMNLFSPKKFDQNTAG